VEKEDQELEQKRPREEMANCGWEIKRATKWKRRDKKSNKVEEK